MFSSNSLFSALFSSNSLFVCTLRLLIDIMKTILCLLMLYFTASPLFIGLCESDKKPLFDNLNKRTELLSSRCIDQDKDGTIWFGTDKYLYSYDGYELKSHPNGIGHIQINDLEVVGDTIILGCNEGLYIYSIESDSYTKIDYYTNDPIRSIIFSDATLFIGAKSGEYVYHLNETGSSSALLRISSDEVFSTLLRDDILYVGNVKGLGEYSLKNKKYKDINISFESYSSLPIVTTLFSENDSTLWIGTPSALIKADVSTWKIVKVLSMPVLKSICRDEFGHFIIGTDNGLILYNEETGKSQKIRDGAIWSNYTDKAGDLWFATDNGLLLASQKTGLKTLPIGSDQSNTLFSYMMKDSKGRLWAGSANGLILFEKDDTNSYYLSRYYSMNEGTYFIPHNKVKKIVEDRHDGSIYIATDGGYLLYNENSRQFERLGITGIYNWFYDIIIDGNHLWLASFEGLFCITKGEVKYRFTTSDGLSSDDIAQIAKDRGGNIWILTRDQNVFILDVEDKSITKFNIEEYASGIYPDCIISDIEGTIWISVKNELIHVNRFLEKGYVKTIEIDAKKSLEIFSINDIAGKIWICSSDGIYVLDKLTETIGRINSRTQYVSSCYDENESNILFGALGKISYFSMDEIEKLSGYENCHIAITSVLVNGSEEIPRSSILSKHLTLSSNQNNLNISFSDFNYSSEIPRRFHFCLSGKTESWNEVDSGHTIMLTDIKPGKYVLLISSNNNMSNVQEALHIIIHRPWYLSVVMMIVYIGIACAIVYWIIRFFTIKRFLTLEREQREVLLEQSKQKEAFFGNIAHEFKTPLSLIIAPLSKLLLNSKEDGESHMIKIAYENATKLNSLVHHTIDYYNETNQVANDLIKSEVEFVEFARTIFNSYKENYPKNEFIFDSSHSEIITDVDIVKMETVLNNLLSNACKYTPEGGSIIMVIDRDDENSQLIIKVSDTGIGIPKEELSFVFQRYFESSRTKQGQYDSTGIGLSVIKKNVESHGGKVGVDSDNNGTTFAVIIPCKAVDKVKMTNEKLSSVISESKKPLIVIVDDNAQICNFLETVLTDKYRCVSSNNGKSGLKLCKEVVPDLIISDVMMPVMDGLEMCKLIREYVPLAMIPIILLTAKGDKDTEKKSIALNIDSFVPKPFEFSTLIAKIDQLIGNKQRMEQRLRLEMISTPQNEHELSYDEKYLKKVTQMIEDHVDDTELTVKSLCELGKFNEKQLYRKVKQLTGLSTIEYIRSIRLKKAAILLQNGNFTISEVMYSVGFSNASYFTRAFSAEFGQTPSDYVKSHK